MYRLIDELQPSYVFLENTPLTIKDENYPHIRVELIRRGYVCAFMIASTSEMGEAHKRNRWFVLAVQKKRVVLDYTKRGTKNVARISESNPARM